MNKLLYHKIYWLYHVTAVIRIHFFSIIGKAHKQIDIIREHQQWRTHQVNPSDIPTPTFEEHIEWWEEQLMSKECEHNWVPYVWNINGESFKCTKCGIIEK